MQGESGWCISLPEYKNFAPYVSQNYWMNCHKSRMLAATRPKRCQTLQAQPIAAVNLTVRFLLLLSAPLSRFSTSKNRTVQLSTVPGASGNRL